MNKLIQCLVTNNFMYYIKYLVSSIENHDIELNTENHEQLNYSY